MKNNLTETLKVGILIFGICLFLTNCEKQDNEITNEQQSILEQHTKSKIEKLSLDELSSDDQFQEISNAFKLDRAFISAKTTQTKDRTLDGNGFEIDFSSAKKVSTTLGDSYTFLIKSKDSTAFDNLVVEKTKDGKVRGYIMHYEYSQRYLDSLKKGILLPFEGTLRQTLPKDNFGQLQELFKGKKGAKASASKSAGLVCVETTVIVESKCPTGTHSNGQYCNVTNSIWYGYAYQTYIDCVSTSNGHTNTWGWVAESSSYSTTVPDPNVTSGGGTYSTTATVEPNLFDDVEDIQSFVNFYGLEGDEIEWARYRPNRNMVEGFMEENNYTTEAKAFVKQAANALVNEGEVEWDEKLILDSDLKDNDCLNSVYADMGKAPTFANYLKNFDGNMSVANLKLTSSSSLSNNTNAETSAPQNYLITITFNESNLDRPKLSIARTFIHEIIHAEIFRKLLSVAQHPSIQLSQSQIIQLKNDYPGLYDYYTRWKNNVPTGMNASSAQHQAMAQHYRDIIKQALMEYDNTQSNDIYDALSWVGLKNTIAWNSLSQTEKDNLNQTLSDFENNNPNCQ